MQVGVKPQDNKISRTLWCLLLGLSLSVASASADDDLDPWEDFNRKVFAFNEFGDRWVLKPIAQTYVFITPRFLRRGITNVFSNVLEVPSALNGALQGKGGHAGNSTGRFLINSTLGVAGLFDVAQHMGLERRDREDFGQTHAVWGVGQGNYVVLPFLGPSTVRDSFALPVEWYTDPVVYISHTRTRNQAVGVGIVNDRANLMDLEKHISGDRYTFIRDAYLQRRRSLVYDGRPPRERYDLEDDDDAKTR
jgi:phospholipid-binding lipoprotein MlaA